MKFNLKMIATAVAMIAASSAHADLVNGATGSGSLFLTAFNQSTNAYYVRDLGYTLNQFLPSSITTAAGDGAVTGDKTPTAGLTIDKTTKSNFADASFSTWLAGQSSAADVRWTIAAGDSASVAGTNNVSRVLLTANNPGAFTNLAVTTAVAAFNAIGSANAPMGLSATGAAVQSNATDNFAQGSASLGLLDSALSVYYYVRSQGTLANATASVATQFGNGLNFATFKLASNGDVTYALAGAPEAVPLPAAAWMLGSGLLGLAGVGRRKAKAKLAA
ncbi:VPLPA-CTERM sorting domain-containing protein [Methylibium sp.]|uniref:VPLPA-CTERM sorting domain-containing protein n=1 Tax=Methylibium sp. TaxID=2067992 RepID=UPI003D0E33F9